MRNKIRKYEEMTLTAVKGVSGKPYLEFELGDSYVALDREAMIDLIRTTELALLEGTGYAASDKGRKDIEYKA